MQILIRELELSFFQMLQNVLAAFRIFFQMLQYCSVVNFGKAYLCEGSWNIGRTV